MNSVNAKKFGLIMFPSSLISPKRHKTRVQLSFDALFELLSQRIRITEDGKILSGTLYIMLGFLQSKLID